MTVNSPGEPAKTTMKEFAELIKVVPHGQLFVLKDTLMLVATWANDDTLVYLAPDPAQYSATEWGFFIATIRNLLDMRAGTGGMSW